VSWLTKLHHPFVPEEAIAVLVRPFLAPPPRFLTPPLTHQGALFTIPSSPPPTIANDASQSFEAASRVIRGAPAAEAVKHRAMGHYLSRRKTGQKAKDDKPASPPEDPVRFPPRYAACHILYDTGIPACIWLEDALSQLGVPTLVFSLFLLVPDADAAAQALLRAGYQRGELGLALRNITQFKTVLTPPQNGTQPQTAGAASPSFDMTPVILLPAKEWFHNLPESPRDMTDWFPTLPQLLTALIAKWLSLEEAELHLRLRIAVFVGYIYEYIDAVRAPDFVQQLPPKYSTFHLNQLQGTYMTDLGTFRCQQHYLCSIPETEKRPP